jgi:hypothetical protein
MRVILAATWHPRGELPRILRLLPQLAQVYCGVAVTFPPGTPDGLVEELKHAVDRYGLPNCLLVTGDWSDGRHLALKIALELAGEHVHYVDFDRLLRWVETREQEWRQAVERLAMSDCLVIGRTPAAYATHPQALVQTELISNRVVSHLLGLPVDVSAGSKGFSRQAAEFLAAKSPPGRAMGTDADWPIRLMRGGYRVDYIEVDGLDWEIPDQHQDQAADVQRQRTLAAEYDADPAHWARRAAVALEIVESAFDSTKDTKLTKVEKIVDDSLLGEKNDQPPRI